MVNTANRSIFRADAVRRHMQGRERSVLPRFISPRTFICLWVLLGLFLASGLVAWLTRVPVFTSGPAVVVDRDTDTPDMNEGVAIVAFLPPEDLSRLRVGQRMFFRYDRTGERVSRPIIAIEREITSPAAAQRRFDLSAGAAQTITRPAAVAVASLGPLPAPLPAHAYVGSVNRVDVEIGTRRVISLVPLVGRLFTE